MHNGDGVVLLHGLGRSGGSMLWLARQLRKRGYVTLAPTYSGRRHDVRAIVMHLDPRISAFAASVEGRIHFVTHSLGGLIVRAYLGTHRPSNLGRVVMLAPPNQGSEWADLLIRWRIDKPILGPVANMLATKRSRAASELLGIVDYPLGVIAGNRSLDPIFPRFVVPHPNDGKVSVAATQIEGMTDHVIMPVTHTLMTIDRRVIGQTVSFLETARFSH